MTSYDVTLRLWRGDPGGGDLRDYTVACEDGEVVLDAIHRVQATQAGDLAVRKAFDHYYGRGRTLSEDAIRRRARAWGPYQNLAIHYLLAGLRLARPAAGGGT